MNLAYIRVSTNKQDMDVQKLQIHEYCYKNNIKIDKFIEIEQSTRKSQDKRRISELKNKLQKNDLLIVVELSRLGRSMLEVMNFVLELSERGVYFIFLRQPELNILDNTHSKLLLAVYAYMGETERDFISQRTKAGLAKAKQEGKKLGRPLGSNKSKFDKDIDKVKELLGKKMTMMSIWKLLYTDSGLSYDGFRWWCRKRTLTKDIKNK